jgi:transposase InsO family protein/transposase-like protein
VALSYKTVNISQLAIELDIRCNLLHRWRQLYKKFGPGSFPGTGNIRGSGEQLKIYELEKIYHESMLNLEILKNGQKYIHKGRQEIYDFIRLHEGTYPIKKMCHILGVGLSTYYKRKKTPLTKTQIRVNLLQREITSVYFEFKGCCGTVLITRELQRRGFKISQAQVSFHMKQLKLRCKVKRRFKVTTNSQHNLYISPNLLNRNFKVNEPARVWVSDITYVQIEKRFLYLTVIMDLYDRKIVGWHLGSALSTKKTTLPAWNMAVTHRKVSDGLIFHSDRGVQYANKMFTNILDTYKCVRSMNRKGDHLDNAVSESFFNTLKRELLHPQRRLLNTEDMRSEIFEYIENWYNKKRIHSTLNYKTIPEFIASNEKSIQK